jgi:hypothetical protein
LVQIADGIHATWRGTRVFERRRRVFHGEEDLSRQPGAVKISRKPRWARSLGGLTQVVVTADGENESFDPALPKGIFADMVF